MLEGVCVSPCSTSCDASAVSTDCLVVVWRLYTSYPETRLATFLQSSSNLPPLFLHSFTIKPLDLHWSHTGLTLEQHCSYSYPTFVLRQMTMRYSVTPKSYPSEPLIAVWSLLYVRSPYTPLTTALFQHFSKKYPKSFVVSKNLCTFALYKT